MEEHTRKKVSDYLMGLKEKNEKQEFKKLDMKDLMCYENMKFKVIQSYGFSEIKKNNIITLKKVSVNSNGKEYHFNGSSTHLAVYYIIKETKENVALRFAYKKKQNKKMLMKNLLKFGKPN